MATVIESGPFVYSPGDTEVALTDPSEAPLAGFTRDSAGFCGGCRGASRDRAGPGAHLLVIEINSSTLSGLEPLLSIEALSEYLDVPVTTIRDWRTDGRGRVPSVSEDGCGSPSPTF